MEICHCWKRVYLFNTLYFFSLNVALPHKPFKLKRRENQTASFHESLIANKMNVMPLIMIQMVCAVIKITYFRSSPTDFNVGVVSLWIKSFERKFFVGKNHISNRACNVSSFSKDAF